MKKTYFYSLYLSGMYAGNSQQLFLTFQLSTKLHVNVTVGNVTVGYLTITDNPSLDLFQINLDVCDSNSQHIKKLAFNLLIFINKCIYVRTA